MERTFDTSLFSAKGIFILLWCQFPWATIFAEEMGKILNDTRRQTLERLYSRRQATHAKRVWHTPVGRKGSRNLWYLWVLSRGNLNFCVGVLWGSFMPEEDWDKKKLMNREGRRYKSRFPYSMRNRQSYTMRELLIALDSHRSEP